MKDLPFSKSRIGFGFGPWSFGPLTVLALAAWLATSYSGFAQATKTDQDKTIEQLLKRVGELEAEVKAMKPGTAKAIGATPAAEAEARDIASAAEDRFPDLRFNGFGDVSYRVNDRSGDRNTFVLGQLDFFLTSRLSENLSVLTESVVEADGANNLGFEVERLLLQYKPSDYFNVDVGRYHTAIGYYNTAYHHGTYLQTATGRPFFWDFEDGTGGILPTHNVGVSVNGAIPSGSLGLHYVAEVGNGRSYSADKTSNLVLNIQDDNDYKAVNVALLARPEWARGLQLGVSAYHDTLTPGGLPRADQTILAAHLVYQNSPWEFINEGYLLRHELRGAGHATYTPAFFTQVARSFGPYRPYVRFQYLNVQNNDELLKLVSEAGSHYGPAVGVRYDFSSLGAVKVQYDYVIQRNLEDVNEVTLQVAFTF